MRYQIRIPEAGRSAERIPENLPADQDLKAAVPEEEGGSSGGGAVEKPEDSGTDETVTEDGEDAYIPVKSAEDFSDVGQNDWFFEAVDRVCGLGLMTGVTDTEFSPESCMSRGMIATLLQRLDQAAEKGESSSEASMDVLPFSDVAADAWYAPSVDWAYENGIVNGISAGKFSPDGDVTREQTARCFIAMQRAETG